MKLKQGCKYSIESDFYNGDCVFINEDPDCYFFKLKSGYNVGIDKKKLTKAKLLEEVKPKKEVPYKQGKADILILHTGGTIASKVDYSTGAVSDKFSPQEIISMFPELKSFGSINSKLISNMPSDDMNFNHYNVLIDEVLKHIDDVKGIIITHGTDTLHYTSCALSFALRGIKKPVVLVGSQRSSDRPSSDAANNLLNASYFIKKNKPGVFVCMHESISKEDCLIFKGVNLRKMHSSRRDAFKQINSSPYARVNFKEELFEEISTLKEVDDFNPLKFNPKLRIGMISSRPNMYSEEFKLYEKFDGLVLQGTGFGHFPITKFDSNTSENQKIFESLQKLSKKIPVVMSAQTIHGRVNLNVYTPGRKLKALGILGHGFSMTPETSYIKLAFILSNYKNQVGEFYEKDFVGELDYRSEV